MKGLEVLFSCGECGLWNSDECEKFYRENLDLECVVDVIVGEEIEWVKLRSGKYVCSDCKGDVWMLVRWRELD